MTKDCITSYVTVVSPITERVTKWPGRDIHSVGHCKRDDLHPGRTEQDGTGFHHTAQYGVQFKMYQLFISGIFHLIVSDCG